eukprot:GEZU01008412.1.p1 GENE.GEZU01008412.1~~GEZU01008412.1.p1  ORF type:complete len:1072 (-),score=269.80 GEZU01008412.1:161-3376(-)
MKRTPQLTAAAIAKFKGMRISMPAMPHVHFQNPSQNLVGQQFHQQASHHVGYQPYAPLPPQQQLVPPYANSYFTSDEYGLYQPFTAYESNNNNATNLVINPISNSPFNNTIALNSEAIYRVGEATATGNKYAIIHNNSTAAVTSAATPESANNSNSNNKSNNNNNNSSNAPVQPDLPRAQFPTQISDAQIETISKLPFNPIGPRIYRGRGQPSSTTTAAHVATQRPQLGNPNRRYHSGPTTATTPAPHHHSIQNRQLHSTTAPSNEGAPVDANTSDVQPRQMLVEYHHFGVTRLGLIKGPHKHNPSKWEILNTDGEINVVEDKNLTFQIPVDADLADFERVKKLEEHCHNTLRQINEENILQMWKQYQMAKRLGCKEAAIALFGNHSPESLYSAHCLLRSNSIYFKPVSKQTFECNTHQHVEEQKKKLSDQAQKDFQDKLFLVRLSTKLLELTNEHSEINLYSRVKSDALREMSSMNPEAFAKLSEKDFSWDPERDKHFIDQLKSCALGSDHGGSIFNRFFAQLNVSHRNNEVYNMCIKLGIFSPYENIHLLKSGLNRAFPSWAERLAYDIYKNPSPDPDVDIRRDLTHLQSFAIDSIEHTVEVDDAISLEVRPDGQEWVYVHIADVTRYLSLGSEMDTLASSRASSIYLPEHRIPMLPYRISVDTISLSSKKTNYALTFAARIGSDGRVEEYDIFPSTLSSVTRLDYTEIDDWFNNSNQHADNPTFNTMKRLFELATNRLTYRLKNGAVHMNTPHTELDLIDVPSGYNNTNDIHDKEVRISISNEYSSYSQRIVSEAMIMAGEIAAHFAAAKSIPIPYRGTYGQALVKNNNPRHIEQCTKLYSCGKPISDAELCKLVIAQNSRYRHLPTVCMQRQPTPHVTLGLGAYTQCTSPIRRYSDVLVHYQLKAALRGQKAPLDWEELSNVVTSLDALTQTISTLQKNSERFWLIKYFSDQLKRDPNKLYKSLVLDSKRDFIGFKTTLYMLEIGHRTRMTLERATTMGDIVYLQVKEAVPHTDLLTFKEVPIEVPSSMSKEMIESVPLETLVSAEIESEPSTIETIETVGTKVEAL